METKKYCVYNKTKERSLSAGVAAVDTAIEPFKVLRTLTEADALSSESGLWLTPFRGLLVAPIYSPFDLVYLDEEYRVLEDVQFIPAVGFTPFQGQASSALILPFQTIQSSQTHPGDQLTFNAVEGTVRETAQVLIPTTLASVPHSPESPANHLQSNVALAAPPPEDHSRQSQAFVPGAEKKEKADSQAQEDELLQIRSLRWAEKLDHQPGENPIPTTPASGPPITEFPAEGFRSKTGLAPTPPDDRSRQHRAASRGLVETKNAEFPTHEKNSLVTRLMHWLDPSSVPTDRRGSPRRPVPGLVAYDGVGGTPQSHKIGDISSSGIFLVTKERWPAGELISLTLQKEGPPADSSARRAEVDAGAVRWGQNGIGLSFMLPTGVDLYLWKDPLKSGDHATGPEYVVREFRMARALGFLRRICPPAEEEVAKFFHDGLLSHRVESALEIILKAEEFITHGPYADRVLAHPDLVMRILEHGSWAEVDCVKQLWAGLLATSCTVEGQDESNLVFVDLLSQLAPIHARILVAAGARASKLELARGLASSYPVYCTAEEMIQITGSNDLTKIHRCIAQLSELGLLAKSARSSFISYSEKAKTTPTSLGLQMYARCNGYREAS
jgi:hypothetical protein